jgi:TRAP-type mannitol/chloroaromatic compound transport system substrate-binding protein
MQRRLFLKRAVGAVGASAATASVLTSPALAQGIRKLRMVTSWPKGLEGPGAGAERLAKRITETSGNRLEVSVFSAGELTGAFDVFDAVMAGAVNMYHSADYFWADQYPAFAYFSAVPYGLTASELNAWIYWGGGQQLWDELSGDFGVKALLAGNTGAHMGGWFNTEITSAKSFEGLKYRVPGLGGKVFSRLGASIVKLPGDEIAAALRSGAIDAAEWFGPSSDLDLGLHDAAKYYYYPGIHASGAALSLGINKGLWDGLSSGEQRIIEAAAAEENSLSAAYFNAKNALALETLVGKHGVKLKKFDDTILKVLGSLSDEVLAESALQDDLSGRIHRSYVKFRASAIKWGSLSERAFFNARDIAGHK